MAEIIRILERGNKDRNPLRLVRCSNCAAEYTTRDGPKGIAKLVKCKNCYPVIRDEFMDRNVSSQRKSQLRRHRDGLCTYCIERPGATKELCAEHREVQNARRRVV
jgi:hypothetical protein